MQWYRKMTARPVLQKRRNILKLIHLYEAKRVLWDRSCAHFQDNHARKTAWKEISSEFPCSADELKLKMNTLLKTYERERKKEMCPFCDRRGDYVFFIKKKHSSLLFCNFLIRCNLRSFIVFLDPREVYKSKWFAYNSFDFLRSAKPRPLRSNLWDSDDVSEILGNDFIFRKSLLTIQGVFHSLKYRSIQCPILGELAWVSWKNLLIVR